VKSEAQSKLAVLVGSKKAADDAVNRFLSDLSTYNVFSTGAAGFSSGRPQGGIRGTISSTTSSPGSISTSSSVIYSAGPVAVGSIGGYLERIYGSSNKQGWAPYITSSSSYTIYPMSTTTISAIYGRSNAGIFLPRGSTYLTGIKETQVGSSSLPANIIGDFGCSDNSAGLSTGYGKILTVQPGYITISTASGNVNLRIGSCSRLESNRPNYVASTYDNVFYRGKVALSRDIHLYDLTCLS
jgi:hypothetical protein